MEKQIYPLGKQSFLGIRESGDVYIDKTHFIPSLLEHNFYFLTRPRRFGKSLLLSTLEYFFSGRHDLFKGLAVDTFNWKWEAYPVVRINLGEGSFSSETGLEERLYEIVEEAEEKYGISPKGADPRGRLRNIIRRLKADTGRNVVILVDEYEKPLIDAIGKSYFESYQGLLHDFYSVFKNNEENIKFLFITGVTRLGHLNIFSGLNNLRDISLSDEFASICGITEKEMIDFLSPGIDLMAKKQNISYDEAVAILKRYYDGYHFSESLVDIYNPYSLLDCLTESKISTNWFESGSASYLVNLLQEKNYDLTNIEGIEVTAARLKTISPDLSDPIPLLYQSGYLTIKEYDTQSSRYKLGYPNFEVKNGMLEILIPFYLGQPSNSVDIPIMKIKYWLSNGMANEFMEWLSGTFSELSYDVHARHEREFRNAIFFIFNFIGFRENIAMEKHIATGRIDLLLIADQNIYIFEFKVNSTPNEALNQIREKEYAQPFRGRGKNIFGIGVSFNPAKRIIESYKIEKLN